MTLLHGVYKNKKKIVNDFLTSTLNINLPLEVKVLKPHIFYNDVENGFHSLTYLFEKKSEIINIQQKIIDKMSEKIILLENENKKYKNIIINLKKI